MLELIVGGHGPVAIVLAEPDPILALGVLVAQAVFSRSIPVVVLGHEAFARLEAKDVATISPGLLNASAPGSTVAIPLQPASVDRHLELSTEDRAVLTGERGEGARKAMELVTAVARLEGAERLLDVEAAHIDACIYVGPATLEFAKHFATTGAKFAVPTTLNAISVDRRQWQAQGIDPEFGQAATSLADAYLSMGADPGSLTCAPYLLPNAPKRGAHVVWAESNAVVYANSVIGARTQKYPDMLDVLVAITGRAPAAGCHLDEPRRPTLCIRVDPDLRRVEDPSFWPLLGYAVGEAAGREVVLVIGLEKRSPTVSDLKAFGAAFATTSGSPMFHLAGITPEAEHWHAGTLRRVNVGVATLADTWSELNSAQDDRVDLVALGNPHLSLDEFEELAHLVAGRTAAVPLLLTCGQHVLSQAEAAGYLAAIKAFGAQVITDTCWCMLRHPVVPTGVGNIMTNSAKYAHYGPGEVGARMHFGSMTACVKAACAGNNDRTVPGWLAALPASTLATGDTLVVGTVALQHNSKRKER